MRIFAIKGFLLLRSGQPAQDTQARDLISRFERRQGRDEFGILHLGGFPFFLGHEAVIVVHLRIFTGHAE